ncbi:hypothetical protein DICVIV_12569 [Dictyocaulus viviparus]|uniref:Uncharacterized protein n=1 Tax=Dictyocaulus viviparus TaxID=29172 RepID=A0A0D8XCS2_DICVI|nr:hypothetical protein DICVIV_12569 [Dictyocaulus viviparus]
MSEISDKFPKQKCETKNPQMRRLKELNKKKSSAMKALRNQRRKSTSRKKSVQSNPESDSKSSNDAANISMSPVEKNKDKKPSVAAEPVLKEVTPPDLSPKGEETSWNNHREDELEARLDKLNKILGLIKARSCTTFHVYYRNSNFREDKVLRLKDSVAKWHEKYDKQLLNLELSMKDFETKCRNDKVEISEQISRVEEMSNTNYTIRKRIEKRLEQNAPRMQLEENNRYFTTFTVNFVKSILYYTAQIRDTFWRRKRTKKLSTVESKTTNQQNKREEEEEEEDEERIQMKVYESAKKAIQQY